MDYKDKAYMLHHNAVVVDTHLDLAVEIYNRYLAGEREIIKKRYLENFKKAGFNIIVSSLFIDDKYLPEMALKISLNQINALMEDIEACNGEVVLVKSREQLNKAIEDNKIAILISFEGLEPIGTEIGLLNIFYELGVRAAGLVWSRRNYVADGCHFRPVEEGKKGGLTRFGVEVVKMLEAMNMIIDVSHLNDEGFWDVVKFSNKPIIASHSCARGVHDSMRNLTDEQIKAIASKNGVIGINAYKNIAGVKDGDNPVEKLCDHIEYIVNLVGSEHVGYGFDLCNGLSDSEPKFKIETSNCDSINSHADSLLLTEELLRRGMSEDNVKHIIGGNFLRIFKEILL